MKEDTHERTVRYGKIRLNEHHDDDDDGDDDDDIDHGSHIHLHIESPPTRHFKSTQPFRNSGAEQRQGCTKHL